MCIRDRLNTRLLITLLFYLEFKLDLYCNICLSVVMLMIGNWRHETCASTKSPRRSWAVYRRPKRPTLDCLLYTTLHYTNHRCLNQILVVAVLYISRRKPLCFTAVLYSSSCSASSFFQTLISEVTKRIPFILSHNIRSGCNLVMHPISL